MKCSEPYPDGSYEECQRDLGHPGQHEYLGIRWARPELGELPLDVERVLEETLPAKAWGVNERSYPVVVVETITRIVWVDAESEDEALAYWADDFADLDLKSSDVVDGYLEFQRPDEFQRQEAAERRRGGREIGPEIQCPDCGELSLKREWYHDPYRKCHGPIEWRKYASAVRAYREFKATPVYDAARKQVAA